MKPNKFLAIVPLIFLITFPVYSQTLVTVSWDANTETDLAGYKVYWGMVSRSYPNMNNVGNVVSYQTTIPNDTLVKTRYYFAVTAYDTMSNESAYSEEAWIDLGGIADTTIIDTTAISKIVNCGDVVLFENTFCYGAGMFKIYGASSNRSGFIINDACIRLEFDAYQFGSGSCLDRERRLSVNGIDLMVGKDIRHYRMNCIGLAEFNFTDDCYISGESDANIKIENLTIFYKTVTVKIPSKHTNFGMEVVKQF